MNNKIIYLIRNSEKDLKLFEKSIELLQENFLPSNPYPVFVFHEDIEESYFNRFKIDLTPVRISFEIPDFLQEQNVPELITVPGVPFPFTVGYRHMCRFFSGDMYFQEVLADTDYYLRLDNDSFILNPVRYDLFKFMDNREIIYGFNRVHTDNPLVVDGLWELSQEYCEGKEVLKKPFTDIKHPNIYYTNFEIAKFDWFLQKDYLDYYKFIDKSGGIYHKRWGDAAIKYLGVEMFLEDNKKHCFSDVKYFHGDIF